VSTAFIVAGSVALLLALLLLYAYLSVPPAARGRDPRRGGYMRLEPNASVSVSPGTVERVGTYTGCKTDGASRVARVRLGLPPDPSRTTALGFSTVGLSPVSVTVTRPGTPTTDADGTYLFRMANPDDLPAA
jgi:hypothetical protein